MKKTLLHLSIATVICLPFIVSADIGLQNPVKVNSISELILIVTRVVRYIAIPFVVLAIMWSGWLFIWAAVNGQPPKNAKDSLKFTIVGAFILLSAELIALVMRNTIETLSK
jgi:hypothetical protein